MQYDKRVLSIACKLPGLVQVTLDRQPRVGVSLALNLELGYSVRICYSGPQRDNSYKKYFIQKY